MEDAAEIDQYDRDDMSYLRNAPSRGISELLAPARNDDCGEGHELPGSLAPSRHTTAPTLNRLPPDDIEEVGQGPELAYSIPDDESIDEFDAITERMPSRKSSSSSVALDYYATVKSAAGFLGACNRSESDP